MDLTRIKSLAYQKYIKKPNGMSDEEYIEFCEKPILKISQEQLEYVKKEQNNRRILFGKVK